jgi:hypothetical protein
MEITPLGTTGITMGVALGGTFFYLATWFFGCKDKPGDDDAYLPAAQQNPNACDEENVAEAEADAEYGDDGDVDLVSAADPPPPTTTTDEKKHFLDEDEKLVRARYLFPGLSIPDRGPPRYHLRYGQDMRPTIENVVGDLLSEKIHNLQQEDEARFSELMKRENAVDLCIALGVNETVVRKRYEVIGNLAREFNFTSKTPTLLSIRHLVYRIGVNNPYGHTDDMDGNIRDGYRNKPWLSYLGVAIKKGDVDNSLKTVNKELKRQKYDDCYVHGTTATALVSIDEESDGEVEASLNSVKRGSSRHDFGSGVYCFKGKFQWALSFGIDRCWPIFDTENQVFPKHNPAIILFPKALHFNASNKDERIYEVGKKKPFKEEQLERNLRYKYQEFNDSRKNWKEPNNDTHKHWREFVKLARCYNKVPSKGKVKIYHGLLHDCESVHLTDQCNKPQPDKQNWKQHCFADPEYLGEDRLFIEFDVDWNEWIDVGPH